MAAHAYFIESTAPILGAGNFGLVAGLSRDFAIKLFYPPAPPSTLNAEATMQCKARTLLRGTGVQIPHIHHIFSHKTTFRDVEYMAGLLMDRVPTPAGFDIPVHITLGLADDHPDIDQPWGRDMKRPPAADNPPRGFHAGAAMMEAIWADEGRSADLTIERVAYLMGHSLAACVVGGLIPLDIEFLYGGDGRIYMIDFGLCELATMDPWRFFYGQSSQTLGVNYYVPKCDMRGYGAFFAGYSAAVARVRPVLNSGPFLDNAPHTSQSSENISRKYTIY